MSARRVTGRRQWRAGLRVDDRCGTVAALRLTHAFCGSETRTVARRRSDLHLGYSRPRFACHQAFQNVTDLSI